MKKSEVEQGCTNSKTSSEGNDCTGWDMCIVWSRTEYQKVLQWSPNGKKKRGRPRKNWKATVGKDLEDIGMTWEEVEDAAEDRMVWRSCVAQCAGGTGRTKV